MEKTLSNGARFNAVANPVATRVKLMLVALLCAGVLLGCATIRKATYPQDYVYLERKQVRSEMALLSLYLRQIDEILLDNTVISSDQQARVVSLLSSINASADKLGASNIVTNHLVIDEHIDRFKSDVSVALNDARADPPSYFVLGKLSGSCVACHQYR